MAATDAALAGRRCMQDDADDRSAGESTPTTTTVLGRRAEDLALRHLERAGMQLLTRNYRCHGGEIDLVMLDGATRVLVLVEVRSRSRADFGSAAATIGFGKQWHLTRAARHLLMSRRELRRLRARFDVVAIDPPAEPGGEPQLTWIKGAFGAAG